MQGKLSQKLNLWDTHKTLIFISRASLVLYHRHHNKLDFLQAKFFGSWSLIEEDLRDLLKRSHLRRTSSLCLKKDSLTASLTSRSSPLPPPPVPAYAWHPPALSCPS